MHNIIGKRDIYKENRLPISPENGDMGHKTMQKIVDECVKEGILVGFLEKYGTSAISALFREFALE